jgi:conjugative transposon TraN protein
MLFDVLNYYSLGLQLPVWHIINKNKTMKNKNLILVLFVSIAGIVSAESNPESDVTVSDSNVTISIVGTSEAYNGLSRTIPFRRMIPPYGLQVAYNKTVHILFPARIKYVDLGNEDIIAAIADEAQNVLRVKAAEPFYRETNMSVITDDGNYYSFNVAFCEEPEKLSIEMSNFYSDGDAYNRPSNMLDILLTELGGENPKEISLIMKAIYDNNMRYIKHIGSQRYGIQFYLKAIYSNNDMLYFLTEIKNVTNVAFNVDYWAFTINDRQVLNRTTTQEERLEPVRAKNFVTRIAPNTSELTVLAFPIFTIPENKILRFDIHEKDGGRHQIFRFGNTDLVRAKKIEDFKVDLILK